jgi:corrinoid protein of di/trimethylamine methyltransferase
MSGLYEQLSQALFGLDEDRVLQLTRQALKEHLNPLEVLENGLAEGIRHIGNSFAAGEFVLPHMIIGADIMQQAVRLLEPALKASQLEREYKAKIIIGTAEGDIHDIGKKIVATLLRANGYDVIDLGRDVLNSLFLETVRTEAPDFLCMSALMTTTVANQQKVIEMLQETGFRDTVRVIVGGAAVTPDSAERMKADGYGESASEALAVINGFAG